MTRLFAFIVFFLSLQVNGQTVYYHYHNKKLKLRPRNYRAYVLPQLNSLDFQFKNLLQKLHPGYKYWFYALEEINSLKGQLIKWDNDCYRPKEQCFKQLSVFIKKARQIENSFQDVLNQSSFDAPYIDYSLRALPHFRRSYLVWGGLVHQLELIEIYYGGPLAKKHQTDQLIQDINGFIFDEQLAFPLLLPYKHQKAFELVFLGFINPVKKIIKGERSPSYLLNQLESLNREWNIFHMRTTKSVDRFPKETEAIIKSMHIRWNLVLKVIVP